MLSKTPAGLSNSSLFTLSTGRIILLILALLLVIIRLTQPAENNENLAGQIITGFTVFYCLSVLFLSFIYPWLRDNLYTFVLVSFFIFAIGFLHQIYIREFSKGVVSGFLIYALIAAFYIRTTAHLAVFQLFMVSMLTMLFYLLPDPGTEAQSFLIRFTGVQILAFFILSSRIRSIRRLIEQDLKYQNLIESLFCGVIQTDHEGKITMANHQICRLTGLEKDLLLKAMHFKDLVLPDDHLVFETKLANLLSGQGEKFDLRLRRKSGEPFWVKISASPTVSSDNEISGISMVLADISIEKSQQDQMISHVRDIEMANKALERQKSHLEVLTRTSSQEMRLPLESIRRVSDTLKVVVGQDNPLVSAYLEDISNHTQQIRQKVEGMWEFVATELQKPVLQELDMMALIADIREQLAHTLRENHATIVAKELPIIHADKLQISRLFSNLIENALRHRGSQPPVIQIGYSAPEDREEFLFSVIDNGLGLNREEYERVFHLFKKETEHDLNSIVMGLHICKRIVANHGGRMWFTSSSGKGTSFFFSLPADRGFSFEEILSPNDETLIEKP
ncbi:MAG: ATP-binding protein [Bacteroidia bacterium]|nr:ATP-binding protein [Bacteroidia bacterium]